VIERINEFLGEEIPQVVCDALDQAADYEFNQTEDAMSNLDSEAELNQHADHLNELARLTGHDPTLALETVGEKIVEVLNTPTKAVVPSFGTRRRTDSDVFDDNALYSLFATLKN